jgi:hypothetical protein
MRGRLVEATNAVSWARIGDQNEYNQLDQGTMATIPTAQKD